MPTKSMTSREFNQDTGGAKRSAAKGPVYITDRGRPSHVLMTFDDFKRLAANQPSLVELLAAPHGAADADFDAPRAADMALPAELG